MSLDHLAIRKAYPNAVVIDDGEGAFDSSGNQIVLEQSKIDTARTELNTAYAKVKIDNENIANFTEVDSNDIETVQTPEEIETREVSSTTEKTQSEDQTYENETKEVKDIVTQDEEELWEKFKSRREWKEDNSGITKHEYIDEEKRQRS